MPAPRGDAASPQCRRNAAISISWHGWTGRAAGCRIEGASRWHCGFPPLLLAAALVLPQIGDGGARAAASPSPPTMPSRSSASPSRARPWSAASGRPATRSTARSEAPGLPTFFDSTTAKTSVSGRIGKGGVSPDSYSVDYVYGKQGQEDVAAVRQGQCRQDRQFAAAAAASRRLGAGRRQGTAGRRRSDQRDADRGRRMRVPSAAAPSRRSTARSAPTWRSAMSIPRRSRSAATRARRSPAAGGSSRSPAITAATSRCNTCRPKARSC